MFATKSGSPSFCYPQIRSAAPVASAILITTDVIGVALVIEGTGRLLRLAARGFPNATSGVLKSVGFFALGFLAVDLPWDNDIVATIALGSALSIDGCSAWRPPW